MAVKKMNNKGRIILRDLLFMAIIFAGLMTLIGVFVLDMADEYSSASMREEYIDGGGDMFGTENFSSTLKESTENLTASTSDNLGSLVVGTVKGAASTLKIIVLLPIYIEPVISKMLVFIGVPMTDIGDKILNIILMLIYGVIAFVIISALLKGGEA